jgi:poly-beta-1,6-N-acetyl-D-glucosamine biosynthesis protein PgaD
MSVADRPWPPLVIAEHLPRAVKWRDALLTLLAWAAFAMLLDEEFRLTLGALEAVGVADADVETNWLTYAERLVPFLLVAAALGSLLCVFSLRTLRRRARALDLPQPAPLAVADEARAAGLHEADLLAAREQRVVVVHDGEGGLRIEAKSQS